MGSKCYRIENFTRLLSLKGTAMQVHVYKTKPESFRSYCQPDITDTQSEASHSEPQLGTDIRRILSKLYILLAHVPDTDHHSVYEYKRVKDRPQ